MAELEPVLIKDLGALTAAADTDYMILGSGADAKKITVGNLKTSLGAYDQTMLSSANSGYFTGVSYAFKMPRFSALVINLNFASNISAGNTSVCLRNLPFTWRYDFTIPVISVDGTTDYLIGKANTKDIALSGKSTAITKGSRYCGNIIIPDAYYT